jgi:hypothetical protein
MLFHGEITNTVKQLHAINRAKEIIRSDAKVTQQQKQQDFAIREPRPTLA